METIIVSLGAGLLEAVQPLNLMMIVIGCTVGLFVGAMPGLGAPVAGEGRPFPWAEVVATLLMLALIVAWYRLFDIRLFLGKIVGRQ